VLLLVWEVGLHPDGSSRAVSDFLWLGQLPQNIALRLKQSGVKVLGTDPEKIDTAEDRHKFSSVLDSIGVDQPDWTEVTTVEAAKHFATHVG
jgi:carbamoyl-phosphate synthase large subunit